jgi:uncharacterized protein YdhG (YjbR/CyaY superfamily)
VRAALRKALSGAEERIGYGIPCYRVDGRNVLYFASWTAHWSLYPATPALVAALRAELAPYPQSKGTIRFPLEGRAPLRLVARIAMFRAREEAQRSRAKSAKSKRAPARR